MNGSFAVDTNAVVDYLRADRSAPPALLTASEVLLPLTVLGELFAGAFASARVSENAETATIYGCIRADDRRRRTAVSEPTKNDFQVVHW